MHVVHVHVFFYEDILDPEWIFVIYYDPRLRYVFDDASMDTKKNNDIQKNEREGVMPKLFTRTAKGKTMALKYWFVVNYGFEIEGKYFSK